MPRSLEGLPIVITGGGTGIGRATALRCAEAGMPVVVTGRRAEPLEAVVDEIRSRGGRAEARPGNAVDGEAARGAVEACVERFGGVYAVFANAGFGVEAPVHEMSDSALREIFEVNFFGSMRLASAALPMLLESGRGHILFCSSCVSKMTLPFYGAYSATKAAQNHIARAMRLELLGTGVHVSSVHPIGTKTEFFDVVKSRSGGAETVMHTPSFLLQPPDRVARAIVRCLRRPTAEVWTSRAVRAGMAFCVASPSFGDLFLRGMLRDYRAKRENSHAGPPPGAAQAGA